MLRTAVTLIATALLTLAACASDSPSEPSGDAAPPADSGGAEDADGDGDGGDEDPQPVDYTCEEGAESCPEVAVGRQGDAWRFEISVPRPEGFDPETDNHFVNINHLAGDDSSLACGVQKDGGEATCQVSSSDGSQFFIFPIEHEITSTDSTLSYRLRIPFTGETTFGSGAFPPGIRYQFGPGPGCSTDQLHLYVGEGDQGGRIEPSIASQAFEQPIQIDHEQGIADYPFGGGGVQVGFLGGTAVGIIFQTDDQLWWQATTDGLADFTDGGLNNPLLITNASGC